MYKSPFSNKEFEFKDINEHDQILIDKASKVLAKNYKEINPNEAETLDGFNKLKTIYEFLKFKGWKN